MSEKDVIEDVVGPLIQEAYENMCAEDYVRRKAQELVDSLPGDGVVGACLFDGEHGHAEIYYTHKVPLDTITITLKLNDWSDDHE